MQDRTENLAGTNDVCSTLFNSEFEGAQKAVAWKTRGWVVKLDFTEVFSCLAPPALNCILLSAFFSDSAETRRRNVRRIVAKGIGAFVRFLSG